MLKLGLAIAMQVLGSGHNPAVAPDGRIAYESAGDLYVQAPAQPAVRLTRGPALDRQPAWSADGRALVFVSDRSGNADLWRLAVNPDGSAGALEQLTRTAEPESEPAVSADGKIVFVRTGPSADLYVLAEGRETRLPATPGDERSPAVSVDGRVAYSAVRDGRRQLRIMRLDGTGDRAVLTEHAPDYPSFSPDGRRIAFVSLAGRRAVMITDAEGSYANVITSRRGRPVWLPSGDSLLISELTTDNLSYNGDPDRVADREAERTFYSTPMVWRVAAPLPPDVGGARVDLGVALTDSTRIELLERAARRVSRALSPNRAAQRQWEETVAAYRARAAAARDRAELDQVLHELLQRRPPLREEAVGRAAVSSAHALATSTGLEILRKGGNVVDAAIAVSFALGVVEPDASGIGGYGEMLIQLNTLERPMLLEFMSRVPEDGGLDNAALADPSLPRAALANVPGTVDGMWRAWQRYGGRKVEWRELLEPAIRLAEEGFALDDAIATTLRREQQEYSKYESTRALFFRDGRPLAAGDTLRNPDLAWTLKQIAQGGADAFYRGEIARRMVNDLRARGSTMSMRDLARYYSEWREPVTTTYRGHTIFSSAPPASGGAMLAAQLNLLEQAKLAGKPTEDAATAHAMIEAWRLIPRSRIADPGLWPVDISAALSKDTARARWNCFFSPKRAVPQRLLAQRPDPPRVDQTRADTSAIRCPNTAATDRGRGDTRAENDCDVADLDARCRATGTTSFAVADADGNMVAVTQTLGTWGGTFYITPGLGFHYNDKLRSYADSPDAYGARLPFARHGSTLAPTLVFTGIGEKRKPLLATGAAGNAWITSAVYAVVTGVIDFGLGPQQALEQPRFLPGTQTAPDGSLESVIQIESGFAPAVLRRLEQIGHRFNLISLPGELRMGYGAAVLIDDGAVRAGGDPRRSGAAGALNGAKR